MRRCEGHREWRNPSRRYSQSLAAASTRAAQAPSPARQPHVRLHLILAVSSLYLALLSYSPRNHHEPFSTPFSWPLSARSRKAYCTRHRCQRTCRKAGTALVR